MIQLAKKNFVLQMKNLSLLFFIMFLSVFPFTTKALNDLSFIANWLTYSFFLGNTSGDDRILWSSLPIPKRKIVADKYLSILVYLVIIVPVYLISNLVLSIFSYSLPAVTLNFSSILVATLAISILSSLYWPFYFRFAYKKSRYWYRGIEIFLLLGFRLPSSIFNLSEKIITRLSASIKVGNIFPTIIIVLGLSAIILSISFLYSLRFYQESEPGLRSEVNA